VRAHPIPSGRAPPSQGSVSQKAQTAPVGSRVYYEVGAPTALLAVYRDLLAGGWLLERVHD
jgi:hypothetical protein